ncbi:MAG: PLP-dependent cysteine synthase family protein [Saprospiraceae bacterium]|nr:PLP-dependent cysteine synthase family protein [Saprospiraceae bacterium]HMW39453.1 PLP-dependent cysteine synthase family protein [Saprospiraceae bacterium]HMX88300.1 PLP-dependent cysteine synthase family protein [Saprospiraceae bacterium]HMZ40416.1 PLP-dependent cysteine synthase family protein [Saprospiraceae bacterium]HNB30253.1 PLP-dependent cysteine synthase family protein [Saprospiraceae bacterium]
MIPSKLDQKFHHLWHLIGNTPMLEINYRYRGKLRKVFVKCEHYNLTGSIKDRMALYVLQQAYKNQEIHPGDIIVEATSGNTGIAIAAIGRALGHKVRIIMPDWLSRERKDIILSMGADVIPVSKQEGGFLGSIELSRRMAAEDPHVFLTRQFENPANADAHEKTTAKEIWVQMQHVDLIPDAFVAGVGTGGTIMGVGHYLKGKNPNIRVHPLEPAESPTLSVGHKVGSHRIQGISDEFIPAIVRLEDLDAIVQASDGDAIIMAQMLARQLGLAVGISSGANLIGAIKIQEEMGDDACVTTVFCDSNKKYLSTDLMKEEPVRKHYISPEVELLDYTPIHRI